MNAITTPIKTQFDRVYDLLENAIESCPDSLWTEKIGGFFYWQQLYHVFAIIEPIFLDGKEPLPSLFPPEVAALSRHEQQTPDKAAVLKVAREQKAIADAWFAKATEEDLWKKHEGRSKRWGREVNVLEALMLLVGHGYYHVGVCDVALRDRGLKGMM